MEKVRPSDLPTALCPLPPPASVPERLPSMQVLRGRPSLFGEEDSCHFDHLLLPLQSSPSPPLDEDTRTLCIHRRKSEHREEVSSSRPPLTPSPLPPWASWSPLPSLPQQPGMPPGLLWRAGQAPSSWPSE